MRAKDYLMRIEEIDTAVRIKNDELLRYQEKASGIGNYPEGERVLSSRNVPDRMAEVIAKYAEIKDELIKQTLELAKERQGIIDTISRLQPIDYEILYSKYAKGESFYVIGANMGKSYRWVVGKHGTALIHLQKLLDQEQ